MTLWILCSRIDFEELYKGCPMIDNKKEQERDGLHHTIWNMTNDLRGSVDGWDFKQYVLGLLSVLDTKEIYPVAFKIYERLKAEYRFRRK